MSNEMTIIISYTEDGMFGPAEENREGTDITASFARYEKMLTEKLQEQYPDAEIEFKNNDLQDKVEIWPPSDEGPWVDEIVNQVWQSWEWIVTA